MLLAPMRYKGYSWPHNPRVYSIDYERNMAVNKIPFGYYFLQDLGRTRRVMRGEGEFCGEDAYAQFGELANVFYEKGPGILIHPLWQTASAYFVELRLEQEPRPWYVRYSFAFWEENSFYSGLAVPAGGEDRQGTAQSQSGTGTQPRWHTVARGDTLWALAGRYGLSLAELVALNPQIKNPNLIRVGQEVRVR